ncbi:MAG: hypothetical protein ACREOH_10405 [Candidatus Entotheonellia bacterium]
MEGLWTAEFGTASGMLNGGVVVLESGRILGGDSGYYYTGKYSISGDTLSGDLRATHYYGPGVTAFGDSASMFTIELTGKINSAGDHIDGLMVRSGVGQVRFRLSKRATLRELEH